MLEHEYSAATCTTPQKCTTCGTGNPGYDEVADILSDIYQDMEYVYILIV